MVPQDLDGSSRPFGDHLDGAVGPVADHAAELELAGATLDEVAKSDALDGAVDHGSDA
jgi:hypothetical protein